MINISIYVALNTSLIFSTWHQIHVQILTQTQERSHGNVQDKIRKHCGFKLSNANKKKVYNVVPENESAHEGGRSLGCDRAEGSQDSSI